MVPVVSFTVDGLTPWMLLMRSSWKLQAYTGGGIIATGNKCEGLQIIEQDWLLQFIYAKVLLLVSHVTPQRMPGLVLKHLVAVSNDDCIVKSVVDRIDELSILIS